MALASLSITGDEKSDSDPGSAPKMTPSLFPLHVTCRLTSSESIALSARDTISKRLFEDTFTHDELVESGFPPMYTLAQIETIVWGAIKGDKNITTQKGYVESAGGQAQAQSKKEGEGSPPMPVATPTGKRKRSSKGAASSKAKAQESVVIRLKEEYSQGDRLALMIVHDVGFFKSTYTVVLKETEQDEVALLEQRFNDMREEILALKKENEELKGRINAPALPMGAWSSSTMKGNYKSWNAVLSAPPSGLFQITENYSKITVLQAGVYRIHGMVALNSGGNVMYVYVNGSTKFTNYNYTSSGNHLTPFTTVLKLSVNNYIQIYMGSNASNSAAINILTIEKLA